MNGAFERSALLLKEQNILKFKKSKIAIFGIGGVGSYVCEALIRTGFENLILIDNDTISLSNLNRQIHATVKTIGQSKVEAMKERMLSINPNANIVTHQTFYLPDTNDDLLTNDIAYIVDAIDTVTAKIDLIVKAQALNIPIISAMGAGNKLNPTQLTVSDIYKTSVCPLAKVMRHELKKRHIKSLKVVYSQEEPIKIKAEELSQTMRDELQNNHKHTIPGSVSFVPSVMGLIIASEIVKDLISNQNN